MAVVCSNCGEEVNVGSSMTHECPPRNKKMTLDDSVLNQNKNRVEEEMEAMLDEGNDTKEAVNHPSHYGGRDNPYEVVKVAEATGLDKDAYLFNVLKYIIRADKKEAELQDLRKAQWYLNRRILKMEGRVFHAQEINT
jgi:hypothetical protein